MKKSTALLMFAPLVWIVAGCELKKSENPLSPTVAGPIPGVGISAPGTVQPQQGSSIPVDQQPISLVVENATTTGVRPLTYTFELSTDVNFGNLLLQNEGITPGDGRTAVRLPGPLGPGRSYYWRARAEDGANTGPYSNPTVFNVFTPIVIDRPFPVAPINNVTTTTLQPRFVVNNAPRSGPVTTMSYELQVAENAAFAPNFATWAFVERPGQSYLDAPASLSPGKQYYWHIRAYDSSVTGQWSDVQVFKTPAAIAPPPPTGGGAPGSASCGQKTPQAILECRRSSFGAHMSAAETVSFLKLSAKDINAAGTAGGPWGILVKTSGAQCNGYSCDILCLGNGGSQVQRDVLIDAEGAQTPVWGDPKSGSSIAARPCEAQ